jgi:cytochrome c peroxidase
MMVRMSKRGWRRALGWGVLGACVSAAAAGVAAGEERPGATRPLTRRDLARVELGRRLFFDAAVSRSGVASCGSCHDPEHGFSDPEPRSADDFGPTRRHSQTILDMADNPNAHWDGEFESVEELVVARLGVPPGEQRGGYGSSPPSSETTPSLSDLDEDLEVEDLVDPEVADRIARILRERSATRSPLRLGHGAPIPEAFDVRRLPPVHDRLEDDGRYDEAFVAAFGSRSVTTARLAESIAAYVDSVRSTESPFDRWRAGDAGAMSEAAVRGHGLFRAVGCAQCHLLEGKRPPLTDYGFHNTGVALRRVPAGLDAESAEARLLVIDGGRGAVDTSPNHRRRFKTPTLRDVARRPPYMHDGSLPTLDAVVRAYARGGAPDPERDERLRPFRLRGTDAADLVAFLEALTGDVRPGLAPTLWRARAESTHVRIVDGAGKPMRDLPVAVVASGDTLPGDLPRTSPRRALRTDADGWIRYEPPFRTHARIDLPDGLEPLGGRLVPDTARRVTLRVPVDGRAVLLVVFPSGRPAPESLVVEHETEMALPDPIVPRTTLVRETEADVAGRCVARYVGWFRTDQSPWVRLRLPGDRKAERVPRIRLVKDEVVEHRIE